MSKTILITGATDGIGLETARLLASQGHHLLLHGRNPSKLKETKNSLSRLPGAGPINTYIADLSHLNETETLASAISRDHDSLDVLINNAGVFHTPDPITPQGFDVRFMVNTLAPYRLTQRLLRLLGKTGRVVNLSSAAQSPVDIDALSGRANLSDPFAAYAQSKLALTMWSRLMGLTLRENGPVIVSVNPGSMLGTRMVREGFGVAGADVGIGANVLVRAALSDEFADAGGEYFDNDSGQFASPHPDALDACKTQGVVKAIEASLDQISGTNE